MEPPAGASGAEQLAGSPAAALSAAKEAGHQASTRGAAQQGSRLKRGRSDPLPETVDVAQNEETPTDRDGADDIERLHPGSGREHGDYYGADAGGPSPGASQPAPARAALPPPSLVKVLLPRAL